MKKRTICLVLVFLLLTLAAACKKAPEAEVPAEPEGFQDGTYTGKAKIASPLQLTVQDGKITATLVWSSANYDYMKVNGVRYDAVIEDGHSVFTVPVASLEEPLPVVADTVAMSTPHEIEYTITFDPATLAADAK